MTRFSEVAGITTICYKGIARRLGDGGRPSWGYIFMFHLPSGLYWLEGLPPPTVTATRARQRPGFPFSLIARRKPLAVAIVDILRQSQNANRLFH